MQQEGGMEGGVSIGVATLLCTAALLLMLNARTLLPPIQPMSVMSLTSCGRSNPLPRCSESSCLPKPAK